MTNFVTVANGYYTTLSSYMGETHISSDPNCCCACPSCNTYTNWSIVDDTGLVHLRGLVDWPFGGQRMVDAPLSWKPLAYTQAGSRTFTLKVYGPSCPEIDLDTWTRNMGNCNSADPITLSTYQTNCLTPGRTPDGYCLNEPSGQCPTTIGPGGRNNYSEIYGRIFVGTVDGEWTNLLNWTDSNNNPVTALPSADKLACGAIIRGSVTSNGGDPIVLCSLDIENNGSFNVDATITGNLTVTDNGNVWATAGCGSSAGLIVANIASFDTNSSIGTLGSLGLKLRIKESCTFRNNAFNNGILEGYKEDYDTTSVYVYFYDNSENKNDITRAPNGTSTIISLYNNSENSGDIISGQISLYDDAINNGVLFDDFPGQGLTLSDRAVNNGTITYLWSGRSPILFTGDSINNGNVNMSPGDSGYGGVRFEQNTINNGTLNRMNATFSDIAQSSLSASIDGSRIRFLGSSINYSEISGIFVEFSGYAINESSGVINNNSGWISIDFKESSINKGITHPGGGSPSIVKFYNSASNQTPGYISNDNVEFNDSSFNSSVGRSGGATVPNVGISVTDSVAFNNSTKNSGIINGTAIFNDNSCNDSGTATVFVPDPPPACTV